MSDNFLRLVLCGTAAIIILSGTISGTIRDGKVDSSFVVNPIIVGGPGRINTFAKLPNGKILVGGGFNNVSAGAASCIARLNIDGSFDPGFTGSANSSVTGIFPLSENKILISGEFTQYEGVPRSRIARLNPDGTLDRSFDLNFGNSYVQIAAVQPDEKIIVFGTFTEVSGTPRAGLARLNADGSLDQTFEVGTGLSSPVVYKSLVQLDGKILLAGKFASYNGTPRHGIVRLNTDGSLDTTFVPGITSTDNEFFDISLGPDGKICLAGYVPGTPTIFRLNPDGSLDSSFATGRVTTGSGARILSILAQPDGKVVLGGEFGSISINGQLTIRNHIFRFNSDGSADQSFTANGGGNGGIRNILLDNDKLLVGGDFGLMNGVERGGIARLNLESTLDANFVGFFGSFTTPNVFHVFPDGKILIAGGFSAIGTTFTRNVARLNSDGSFDTAFQIDARVDSTITAIAVQPDGKIVLGGHTGEDFGGNLKKGVWRIHPDGRLDTTFDILLPGSEFVRTIAVQPDGKILIGGNFTAVNGVTRRRKIARLHPDGRIDSSFDLELGALRVTKIALQSDGKIIVAGDFSSVDGVPAGNLVRLNQDGSADTSFNIGSGANNVVNELQIRPDGMIYAGGSFSSFNGVSRGPLVRLRSDGSFDPAFKPVRLSAEINTVLELPNGKIIVGGTASSNVPASRREKLIRLLHDGSVDFSFDAGNIMRLTFAGQVFQVARHPGGQVLVAGAFDAINGTSRWGFVRLEGFRRIPKTFGDFDGDGRSDVSIFRPSTNVWHFIRSLFGYTVYRFGDLQDKLAPADYDGDFITDFAVFRPAEGRWYGLRSSDNSFTSVQWGIAGDLPIPGDFDGDEKADLAVYRPSEKNWYRYFSSDNSFSAVTFGAGDDKPQMGDFDGDGKADLAIYRPATGEWHLASSAGGYTVWRWGVEGDVLVPSDYSGDGVTDAAIFRPSTGEWWIFDRIGNSIVNVKWGETGDVPAPADYDGDGKADLAVFRPSTGQWWLYKSTEGLANFNFGVNGDRPLANSFVH